MGSTRPPRATRRAGTHRAAAPSLEALAELARGVRETLSLEQLQKRVVETAAALLHADRASIRLIDTTGPSGARLVPSTRFGDPLHAAGPDFALGEGLVGWIGLHRRPIRTGNAQRDPRFQPRPAMKERMGSFIGVPLLSGRRCIGVLSAAHSDLSHFNDLDGDVLTLLAAICAPQLELAQLARLAQLDPLTGTLNRRGLEGALPERRREKAGPTSIAIADVDRFKRINDRYGHPAGDAVLKEVARLLASGLRTDDAVVRYGGEEFVMVLPDVDLEGAMAVAERARLRVEKGAIRLRGRRVPITVSFGVATLRKGETRARLIERADRALYIAKERGRNRVESAT
jgi:diguanylate cyclase (GGDEF)-like protein